MSFDSLPPEIAQRCVEFLPFDLVSGDLKAVSKATRGVARRALTRGRWMVERLGGPHEGDDLLYVDGANCRGA